MEIILNQLIISGEKASTSRTVKKSFKSDFVPRVGDLIMDSAFKDPDEYEVHSVTIDLERQEAYVTLKMLQLDANGGASWVDEITRMYLLHNWTSFDFK